MSHTSNPSASGLLGRLTGVVTHPRRAMAAATRLGVGAVLVTWVVVVGLWLTTAAWLLSGPVGRQAVVDERVRVVEALGGTVTDTAYSAWQAAPPWTAYFTSGGRTLLVPAVTLAVAVGLFAWVRRDAPRVRFLATLSVVVHASVVLALQQVVATPLHYLRESLTSPFNLAAVLPVFDEGSLPAAALGTMELFGLWWLMLLAIGAASLTGRRARSYAGRLLGVYIGVAVLVGGVVAVMGGA